MFKNKSEVSKPLVPFLLIGVLNGYMNGATIFIIKSILTLPLFLRKCPRNFPKEFLKSAGFMVHLYIGLQKRMDKEKAFELIRASVLPTALATMQANFRFVEEDRNFENLIKYQKLTSNIGITKLNTIKIVEENESNYHFKVTRCLFYEFFNMLGVAELTSIMCAVDNAVFNCYLPNEIIFERKYGETIAEGNDFCSFCIKKVNVTDNL